MNKIGLPLKQPVAQTIIPVVEVSGNLFGFFTIARTVFTGDETSFALAEGTIDIDSVTLPPKAFDGSGYGEVSQYMAYVPKEPQKRPWLGYSSFVDTNNIGYLNSYTMAPNGWYTRYNRGSLVTSLTVSMDKGTYEAPINNPLQATPASLRWVANIDVSSSQLKAGFFDFPWASVFTLKTDTEAVSIECISLPSGGAFKSTLVANPTLTTKGLPVFNTVRLIRLKDVHAGTYEFVYLVKNRLSQSTQVTLQLVIA